MSITNNLPLIILEYNYSDIFTNSISNKNVNISLVNNSVKVLINSNQKTILDRTPGIIIKNISLHADSLYRLSIKGSDHTGGNIIIYAGSVKHGLIYTKTNTSINTNSYSSATFKPTYSLVDIGVLVRNVRKGSYFNLLNIKLEKISNEPLLSRLTFKNSNYLTLDTYQVILEDKRFNCNVEIDGRLTVANEEIAYNSSNLYNGAVVINGGTNIGQNLLVNSATDATCASDGSIATYGGLGVSKSIIAGNNIYAGKDIYQRGYILTPPGVIMAFSSNNIPNGYLLCDGSAYSRTTYKNLFDIIGTTYGIGDGVLTFNVPNLCNRIIMTKGDEFTPLGATGGNTTKKLSIDEMPSHTHDGSTNETVWSPNSTNVSSLGIGGTDVADDASARNLTFTTNPTGGNKEFSLLNPYFVLNYIIKT